MFFFGCDADDTMQYVVFLNSFDVSGLYLEILFLVTRVFTGSRNLIFNSTRCLQIRYTMTDLARMDFLAIRRSLYYLFQIFLNVSLLWMHGETNGQWLAHKKAIAERECQLSLKKEVCSYIV